jgi:hypothetical protein
MVEMGGGGAAARAWARRWKSGGKLGRNSIRQWQLCVANLLRKGKLYLPGSAIICYIYQVCTDVFAMNVSGMGRNQHECIKSEAGPDRLENPR